MVCRLQGFVVLVEKTTKIPVFQCDFLTPMVMNHDPPFRIQTWHDLAHYRASSLYFSARKSELKSFHTERINIQILKLVRPVSLRVNVNQGLTWRKRHVFWKINCVIISSSGDQRIVVNDRPSIKPLILLT